VAVITAAISPYAETRQRARELIGYCIKVFVECPLDELVRRDVKGLYVQALRGELPDFTGVSDPYEAPDHADVVVHMDRESVGQSVATILALLRTRGLLQVAEAEPSADLLPVVARSADREDR
jgi:adenylylsulfate kinase